MVLILIRELRGWIGIGKVEWAGSGRSRRERKHPVRLEDADVQSGIQARTPLDDKKGGKRTFTARATLLTRRAKS